MSSIRALIFCTGFPFVSMCNRLHFEFVMFEGCVRMLILELQFIRRVPKYIRFVLFYSQIDSVWIQFHTIFKMWFRFHSSTFREWNLIPWQRIQATERKKGAGRKGGKRHTRKLELTHTAHFIITSLCCFHWELMQQSSNIIYWTLMLEKRKETWPGYISH